MQRHVLADIRSDVVNILSADKSGHGMDHIDRVLRLATKFAESDPGVDLDTIKMAVLLHDIDDYKLFGADHASGLINARAVMMMRSVPEHRQRAVLEIIGSMGYSKFLEGVRPTSREGAIVSDADMCDAIGATGILRTHAFTLSRGGTFFDPNILPTTDANAADYRDRAGRAICAQHFFDKLVKIPSLMMTDAGRAEAETRRDIMTSFMRAVFEEENSQEWLDHLDSIGQKK